MKKKLSYLAQKMNKINDITAQIVSWFTLAMVVLLALNILSGWLFKFNSILVTELITWMHSAIFLLATAYTLNKDEHVRVDIFYRKMSVKKKAIVDLLGTVFFLIPISLFILWSSWSYIILSWRLNEQSPEAGGMPAIFILKSLLIIMPVLLIFESFNQLIKNSDRLINNQQPNHGEK